MHRLAVNKAPPGDAGENVGTSFGVWCWVILNPNIYSNKNWTTWVVG